MKVLEVTLEPLEAKYYSTEVNVNALDEDGRVGNFGVAIYGYSPKPSQRELDNGWEPDVGMDHVESDVAHKIALAIVDALKGKVFDQ